MLPIQDHRSGDQLPVVGESPDLESHGSAVTMWWCRQPGTYLDL